MINETNQTLAQILQKRFHKHPERHPNLSWDDVLSALNAYPVKWESLEWMEESGGEPDVVLLPEKPGSIIFIDCAPESPSKRRSLCYDIEALESREKFKPEGDAVSLAAEHGVALLTEEEYALLQAVGPFDRKTSSWIHTPEAVRKLGGALFGDYRFGRVFTYHNGAESYYAARGFRGKLLVNG